MLTLRDTENDDEVDAVKILLNALYSSAPADQPLIPHNEISKNYKSRVTFQQSDLRDTSIHQLQLKASRKPPIIPNAPINKDHQTLLGMTARTICICDDRYPYVHYYNRIQDILNLLQIITEPKL